MYIFDFFKHALKKSNITIVIYFILNILFIAVILDLFFSGGSKSVDQMSFLKAVLVALVLYAISLTIALSPIGEWILRLQTGCKKISRVEQQEILMPIFNEVYEKAKKSDPSLPDDIKLYINKAQEVNAFATGRKTICLTEGLLRKPKEQIKATLAHEFGHLSHKDTDLLLLVVVGNMLVTGLLLFIKTIGTIASIISAIGSNSKKDFFKTIIGYILFVIIMGGISKIWTKLGILLVMKSSRENEYLADKFAYNLGYGNALCELLDTFTSHSEVGVFASLAASHPDKDDRIAALQKLGATYRANYYILND